MHSTRICLNIFIVGLVAENTLKVDFSFAVVSQGHADFARIVQGLGDSETTLLLMLRQTGTTSVIYGNDFLVVK